jgi:hypothetical protein
MRPIWLFEDFSSSRRRIDYLLDSALGERNPGEPAMAEADGESARAEVQLLHSEMQRLLESLRFRYLLWMSFRISPRSIYIFSAASFP